ncbi:MAG: DUF6088 family protein [Candidatus Cyclonatronum sp.]|uniref:DUF6088 family protein n=1 Tax=Cyclonatronum sp. TaxID=3024185 RepID=UPI0025BBE32D|nr:DUF6088 family protein [Cyclonatronum sp.]MCC5935067.1 hypothetical protein [Balneolales bacterium]MCH8487908.1 DUF6088 family protein [Cyclonatronum sp.]
MKTTDFVVYMINRLPKGYVFTYEDFIGEVNNKEAVIKALNRMAVGGKIEKLSKGRYYKPEQSAFGVLPPDPYQVVKDLLEDEGKVTGYLTGVSIYNQLNLTTQVSSVIQIGKNQIRPAFKRGRFRISFILQKNIITKENIPLLQYLDCLRYLKKIPDATVQNSIRLLSEQFSTLEPGKINTMVRLALKYPPAAQALLGAILEDQGKSSATERLKRSLNPITTYAIPGAEEALSTSQNWNIK